MTLRVAHVNCVIDAEDRDPEALLDAWSTLREVAAATARAGAEVTVLQASRVRAEFRRDGVLYRFVPEPRLGGSRSGILPGRLADAVHRAAPDAVHFNGLDFPLHVRAICALGAPVLLQDHKCGAGGRRAPFRRWGHARVAGAAFTGGVQAAAPFLASGELPRGIPIFDIPESSSHFTPGSRDEARRETGVFGDPALLWVGHLDSNKDPLTILRAVQIAREQLPALQLWCVFVGAALLDEVEALLRSDPALGACVHLLGRVAHERIQNLCRACDFLVSGSRWEGSGYALIEALACGLPTIASDIPPFRALTGEASIGDLVAIGDVRGFADAIVRQAMAPVGAQRQRVRTHFERCLSFEMVGAKLVAAYSALAGREAAA